MITVSLPCAWPHEGLEVKTERDSQGLHPRGGESPLERLI